MPGASGRPQGEVMAEPSPARRAFVLMPRLNANEDEARIVGIGLAPGASFDRDTLLFSIETTKAANDVLAPCSGELVALNVADGDMVAVGAPLAEVLFSGTPSSDDLDFRWADTPSADAAIAGEDAVHISAKARLRARELGVVIEQVPAHHGKVRMEDVERFASAGAAGPASPAPHVGPALLARYGAGDAVILGGSGHARTIIDAASGSGYTIIGAVDAALPPGTPIVGQFSVLGPEALLHELLERGVRTAFVGVGGATSNAARRRVFEKLAGMGFHLPPLVARTAYLGAGASLGAATYLLPGANVGPGVEIGDDCIINQNAVVAHDSRIGDHVHLAPNAVVAGHCRIGAESTLGMCATLIYGGAIGARCLVHNNVAVTQDLADDSVLTLTDLKGRGSGARGG